MKLGKHDISEELERGSVTVYPYNILIHPDWKYDSKNFDADIAIILLEREVQMTESIFPICLGSQNSAVSGQIGKVVGWGMAEAGTPNEDKPRELNVTMKSLSECLLEDPRLHPMMAKRTFCAGGSSTSGPCKGE